MTDKQSPTLTTMTINGEEVPVLVYSTGLIKHAETGHFIKPPDGTSITTTERARELAARRKELSRERAIAGMTEGAGLPLNKAGSGEEWQAVIRHVTETLMKSDNLRGQGEVLSKLGRATGYLSEEDLLHEDKPFSIMETLGREAVRAWVAERVAARRKAMDDELDAEVSEVRVSKSVYDGEGD